MRGRAADGDLGNIRSEQRRPGRILTGRIVTRWFYTGPRWTDDPGGKVTRRKAVELGLADQHDDVDRLPAVSIRCGGYHRRLGESGWQVHAHQRDERLGQRRSRELVGRQLTRVRRHSSERGGQQHVTEHRRDNG